MFSVPQQVLRNRRRMDALTKLQSRITERKPNAVNIAVVKEQTQKLRTFFNELEAEEDRIQREIFEIGQKIERLEQAAKGDGDTYKNKSKWYTND